MKDFKGFWFIIHIVFANLALHTMGSFGDGNLLRPTQIAFRLNAIMDRFRYLLFVDDDHPSNVYHRIILEESGLCEEAKFFRKSVEALAFLESLLADDNAILPDVIFLDINMPSLNGWNFLKKLEALEHESYPPIVMLSTSEYHKDIERSEREKLVHSFLCKPLDEPKLKSLMQALAK